MISWLIKTEVWGITDMLFDKSWYHAKADLNICFIMHGIQPFKVSLSFQKFENTTWTRELKTMQTLNSTW